ncbi:TfoX/Sxy family protein [Rhizobium sp. 2YAF20]|uniref:TfoX/Sxy family protein n=1 Tax=Rhizobium sp. 2YAF20 TaxID=3233027 RepID=UPI003F9D7814
MSKQNEQAKQLAAHYVDILSDWAPVTTRPLFGAIALYRDEHVFAMIWKNALYLKVDDASRGQYEAEGSHPLDYQSEGEDRALKSYLEVPAHILEDEKKLHSWADIAYRVALKSPKN